MQTLKLYAAATLTLLAACDPGRDATDGPEPAAITEPVIEQGRLKYPLPGKTVSAGYFELHNHSSADITIIGASADAGSSVEIHRTRRQGDQVRMERIRRLPVAAGSSVSFAPGGLHLMLFGVETLPPATEITLQLEAGGSVTATFTAERW